MKNKSSALFIIALYILSVLPMAFAMDADVGVSSDVSGVAVDDNLQTTVTTPMQTTPQNTGVNVGLTVRQKEIIKSLIKDSKDVAVCFNRAKEKFPQADDVRIRNVCNSLIENNFAVRTSTNAEVRAGIKTQNKIGLKNQSDGTFVMEERREKLGVLNSATSQKIENLTNWQVRRLVDVGQDQLQKLKSLGENELKGLSMLTKDEIKELDSDDIQKIKTQILEKVKEKQELKENDFKRRVVSKETVVKFEQKYKLAGDKYVAAKEKYLENKNQLVKLNAELKLCEGSETEECVALRVEVQEHAKDYLLNAATSAIGVLEKMQSKIDSSEDLDSETVANISAKIESKIQELEGIMVKIEAAQTKEELKSAAEELKSLLDGVKNQVTYNAERVKVARVGLIVERSEHLELRLEAILADMEVQNISVSDIDEKIVEFTDKIAAAREQYALAKSLFIDASDAVNQGQIIKESNVYIKEAQEELQEAHKVLVEILKIVKDNGGNLNAGSEIDDDVDDVSTDEIDEVELTDDFNETESNTTTTNTTI
ncbi:hypothetical protein GQ473_07705 [archaeon]|nr:hypothetical protein [archaeon]